MRLPPLWMVQAGLALVLLTLLGWKWADAASARAEVATVQADIERQVREAEQGARAVENRRVARLQEAQDAEFIARQGAQRDAAAARAAADGLRQRAQAVAATSCPARNPAVAEGSAPAANPARVLADVLGEVGEEARRLAEIADTARIAGQLCERAYDSLTVESATTGTQAQAWK